MALLAATACTPPPRPAPVPPPPPAPPPAPAGPPPFTGTEVWTSHPGVVLRAESGPVTLPWTFMRLAVMRIDSTELQVRCLICRGAPVGMVRRDEVIHEVRAPVDAAKLDLADFALAVRDAARRRDLEALRRVMSNDFTSDFNGPEGVLAAIGNWQGRRASDLERLPFLLDRGIASVGPGGVWAAPPEHATQRGYNDLRAGFRRGPSGWQFIFLVRPGL